MHNNVTPVTQEVTFFPHPNSAKPESKNCRLTISIILGIGSVCFAGGGVTAYYLGKTSLAMGFFITSGVCASIPIAMAVIKYFSKHQSIERRPIITSRITGESLLGNRSDTTTIAGARAYLGFSENEPINRQQIEDKKATMLPVLQEKLDKARKIVENNLNKALEKSVPIVRYESESPLIQARKLQIQRIEEACETLLKEYSL